MSSIADDEDSNSNNHCDTNGGNNLARKTVSQMSLSFNLKYNSAGEDSASEQAPRTFLSYLKLSLSYAKFFLRLFGWGLLGMLPSPASVQFELLTDFKKSEISSQNNARHRVCKKRNSKESKVKRINSNNSNNSEGYNCI